MSWLRRLLDAFREPFDDFPDTDVPDGDPNIPSDFHSATTEPSEWGALRTDPRSKHYDPR